ncbi:MAG: potassium channel family protein [Idiomarina sp.]
MSVSFLTAAFGLLLVCLVLLDVVVTTMTMNGGGAGANWLSYNTWRLFCRVKQLQGSSRMPMVTGPVTLILVTLVWVGVTWLGWALIFSWDAISIVTEDSKRLAGLAERMYYTGYTITTIGYGDFRAEGTLGQIASVIAALNGLSLLTLGVTYSMQVLTAVIEKRRLALMITALNPLAVYAKSTDPQQLQRLADELGKLDKDIASAAQKYLAFPVIHFFPDRHQQTSLPLKIADLWRTMDVISARREELSVATSNQFDKTKLLIRVLTKNAIKCHWAFELGDKAEDENLATEPLETLVKSYVDTSGWDWKAVTAI